MRRLTSYIETGSPQIRRWKPAPAKPRGVIPAVVLAVEAKGYAGMSFKLVVSAASNRVVCGFAY